MRGSMARRGLAWRGLDRRIPPKPKPKQPSSPRNELHASATLRLALVSFEVFWQGIV